MKIAVASGKGGTGKTTVSTNLALCAAQAGHSVAYVDCDVEEPNGHLFLNPDGVMQKPVECPIPAIREGLCNGCGQCSEICQFHAILNLGTTVVCYPELCHGCGGCALVCPTGAICEQTRQIGTLDIGEAKSVRCYQGTLNIGEAMSPPVIRAVKSAVTETDFVIIDAPPGTSCPVVETVRDCDYVLLVTDATPFGLHDLKLAIEVVKTLVLPFGVVINRAGLGEERVHEFCHAHDIPVLLEIPDERKVAEAYSRGLLASEQFPEYLQLFTGLLATITSEQQHAVDQEAPCCKN